ncbi:ArsR/SmtB family transcription factor [Alphaproteobacteria bacterium LSUCC0684]
MDKPSKTYKRKRRKPIVDGNISGSRATTVMKAMSNSQRLEILSHLINGEERSVKELENILQSLSQSALSQHLARLRRAQIVKARRSSQMVFYSIDDANVERIIELLTQIYDDDPVLHKMP